MAIITFGGNIGAGKTTIAPLLANTLGYGELYMGGIFRAMAQERNLSIEAFYDWLGKNPDLERSIDEKQISLMKEKVDIVVQGRIAFFFAQRSGKPSINIFLSVDPRVGAERKIKEGLYPGKSVEEVMWLNAQREANEREHYLLLYGIENHLDSNAFDIVCDTTWFSPEGVLAFLTEKVKNRI